MYGEPDRQIPFGDGGIATVYHFDRHNLILESIADDPDTIMSVQIEGETNPPGKGLLGRIDLGDSLDKAVAAFGDPLERRPAKDGLTGQPVPDTFFLRYSNANFEVVGSRITSIKSIFRRRTERADSAKAIRRSISPERAIRIAIIGA